MYADAPYNNREGVAREGHQASDVSTTTPAPKRAVRRHSALAQLYQWIQNAQLQRLFALFKILLLAYVIAIVISIAAAQSVADWSAEEFRQATTKPVYRSRPSAYQQRRTADWSRDAAPPLSSIVERGSEENNLRPRVFGTTNYEAQPLSEHNNPYISPDINRPTPPSRFFGGPDPLYPYVNVPGQFLNWPPQIPQSNFVNRPASNRDQVPFSYNPVQSPGGQSSDGAVTPPQVSYYLPNQQSGQPNTEYGGQSTGDHEANKKPPVLLIGNFPPFGSHGGPQSPLQTFPYIPPPATGTPPPPQQSGGFNYAPPNLPLYRPNIIASPAATPNDYGNLQPPPYNPYGNQQQPPPHTVVPLPVSPPDDQGYKPQPTSVYSFEENPSSPENTEYNGHGVPTPNEPFPPPSRPKSPTPAVPGGLTSGGPGGQTPGIPSTSIPERPESPTPGVPLSGGPGGSMPESPTPGFPGVGSLPGEPTPEFSTPRFPGAPSPSEPSRPTQKFPEGPPPGGPTPRGPGVMPPVGPTPGFPGGPPREGPTPGFSGGPPPGGPTPGGSGVMPPVGPTPGFPGGPPREGPTPGFSRGPPPGRPTPGGPGVMPPVGPTPGFPGGLRPGGPSRGFPPGFPEVSPSGGPMPRFPGAPPLGGPTPSRPGVLPPGGLTPGFPTSRLPGAPLSGEPGSQTPKFSGAPPPGESTLGGSSPESLRGPPTQFPSAPPSANRFTLPTLSPQFPTLITTPPPREEFPPNFPTRSTPGFPTVERLGFPTPGGPRGFSGFPTPGRPGKPMPGFPTPGGLGVPPTFTRPGFPTPGGPSKTFPGFPTSGGPGGSPPPERLGFPSTSGSFPRFPPQERPPSGFPSAGGPPPRFQTLPSPGLPQTTAPPEQMVPNKIRGKARIVCEESGMQFTVNTIFPFTGQIFAHDRKRVPNCVHTFNKATNVSVSFSYAECGVRNAGNETRAHEQFHLQIIVQFEQLDHSTTVQSFIVQCAERKLQYNKQTIPKRLEEALEELRLVPTQLEQKASIPDCLLRIVTDVEHHKPGDGVDVDEVGVGQPLRVELSLQPESNAYGFLVRNCVVRDMISGMQHEVIDSRGCSTDLNIFAHPHYDTYHDVARVHWHAFKLPDHTRLSLTCQFDICLDIADTNGDKSCATIPTPPFCADIVTSPSNSILFDATGFARSRRSIISNNGNVVQKTVTIEFNTTKISQTTETATHGISEAEEVESTIDHLPALFPGAAMRQLPKALTLTQSVHAGICLSAKAGDDVKSSDNYCSSKQFETDRSKHLEKIASESRPAAVLSSTLASASCASDWPPAFMLALMPGSVALLVLTALLNVGVRLRRRLTINERH